MSFALIIGPGHRQTIILIIIIKVTNNVRIGTRVILLTANSSGDVNSYVSFEFYLVRTTEIRVAMGGRDGTDDDGGFRREIRARRDRARAH